MYTTCYILTDCVAENITHISNTHHQSTDRLQGELESGALYAVPSTVLHDANTTKLEELFDGECYASTYQTNGQCHIYQELPENVKGSPRTRSKSIAVSHEVINSRPPLPLRLTTSSASVSKFPYTMPNTPALSVFNLESGRELHGFSSNSTIPNSGHSDRKFSMISRPGMGSAYLESKPSKPNTPEDTPVRRQYSSVCLHVACMYVL